MKRKVATKSRSGPKRRRTGKKHDSHSADLRALARKTELQLSVIQRRMRQRLQAEFARGNLTGPQRLVMSVLVRHQGLSLKQLSQAVSLAHSTVSGIVDRLVKQGLIERQPHPTDRRVTLLTASDPVRKFMKTRMPELALHPLLDALRLGSPAELHAITKGLDTLAQLFSRTTTTPASEGEILDF
jgi:DNA-binding MarR family transcriptional regulator